MTHNRNKWDKEDKEGNEDKEDTEDKEDKEDKEDNEDKKDNRHEVLAIVMISSCCWSCRYDHGHDNMKAWSSHECNEDDDSMKTENAQQRWEASQNWPCREAGCEEGQTTQRTKQK